MKITEVPIQSGGLHTYTLDRGEFIYEREYATPVHIMCPTGVIEISSSTKPTKVIEAGRIIRIPPKTPHKVVSLQDGNVVIVLFE